MVFRVFVRLRFFARLRPAVMFGLYRLLDQQPALGHHLTDVRFHGRHRYKQREPWFRLLAEHLTQP